MRLSRVHHSWKLAQVLSEYVTQRAQAYGEEKLHIVVLGHLVVAAQACMFSCGLV